MSNTNGHVHDVVCDVVCDECQNEFALNADVIQEATVELDGQFYTLVYFACPECNKIYRITLKDDRYEALKLDVEKAKSGIRKIHGSNNFEMARWLNKLVYNRLDRLRRYTKRLNGKFPGTFAFAVPEDGKGKTIVYLP